MKKEYKYAVNVTGCEAVFYNTKAEAVKEAFKLIEQGYKVQIQKRYK